MTLKAKEIDIFTLAFICNILADSFHGVIRRLLDLCVLLQILLYAAQELAMQPMQQGAAPPHERSSNGKREYSTITCRANHSCNHLASISSKPWSRPML